MIRVPISKRLRFWTVMVITVMLGILLLINTIIGSIQFFEITSIDIETKEDVDESKTISLSANFNLKDAYLMHGIILLLLPCSIFFFLGMLLVKVMCFFFVETQRGRETSLNRLRVASYGYFREDDEIFGTDHDTEDEAAAGYLKGMQRIVFKFNENALKYKI